MITSGTMSEAIKPDNTPFLIGIAAVIVMLFAQAVNDSYTTSKNVTLEVDRPAAPGNVFYVSAISTDCTPATTGSGTLADPWTNAFYATKSGGLVAGDTLQLRAGTYRNQYSGFNSNDCLYLGAGTNTGQYSVMDMSFLTGVSGNEIIIENYPGEDVIIDGTDADMDTVTWVNCAGAVWNTTAFNTAGSRSGRIWVNPTGPGDPGTRLNFNSDAGSCPTLAAGEYSVIGSGSGLALRMPDDSSANDADIRLSCQAGDCAWQPIKAAGSAEYITVRKNPAGGSLTVKYGYFNVHIAGGAHHLTFDGVDYIGAGGRDYGQCFRTGNGNFITVKNGTCRDAVAEGIAHYGGGPTNGTQIGNNGVENMDVYDTGRGWVDGGGNGTSLGQIVILKNCENCFVRDSRLRNGYRNGIQVNQSITCGVPCRGDNVLIERNEIWNACRFRVGSDPDSGQTDCGFIKLSEVDGTIDGGTIRNNMIMGRVSPPYTNSAQPSGISIDGQIPNVVIANNSFDDIPGNCIFTRPTNFEVRIVGNSTDRCGNVNLRANDSGTKPSVAYNNWNDVNPGDSVVTWSGTTYVKSNVTSFEATAVTVDPVYVSATDLHIQASSGLIDALADCSIADVPSDDFDQNARPSTGPCDIGADEF